MSNSEEAVAVKDVSRESLHLAVTLHPAILPMGGTRLHWARRHMAR